jgi:hypothetical protein
VSARACAWLVASALTTATLSTSFVSPALAATVHGAAVIDGAVKIEEDRFKSPQDWDKTIRFFRSVYGRQPGIVWRSIASTPKVKAIHIANTKRGQSWEGINIYQTNGEVFIFVIKADTASKER